MTRLARRFLALVLALSLVPALAACVSRGSYPPSGYIDTTRGMTDSQRDDKFKQEWVSDDAKKVMLLRSFEKIQVRPLNLDHLTDKEKFEAEDLEKLRNSYQKSFEEKLGEKHSIVPADQAADSETLVVDAALVKIYQPWRLLNVITTVVIGPITNGGAAFEARLVDGESGQSLAKMAEKQQGAWHFGSILIGGYLKYYDTEKVFGAWAKRLDAWLSEEEGD